MISTRIRVISKRKVQFPPAECDYHRNDCNFDIYASEYGTHECDYDTFECDLYKLSAIPHVESNFYTQSVISTGRV
jgi:hypothetical protein